MNRKTGTIVGAALATTIALTVTGCTSHGTSKVAQPYNDAKMSKQQIRPTWNSISAPDGFSNSATACLKLPNGVDPHIRMFAMYHGNSTSSGDVEYLADQTC